MAAPLLLVSGPSGAGKTTIGALVAAAFDLSARVGMDDVCAFVVNGWVDQWLPESAAQGHALGGAAASAAIHLAEFGYTTVLDGHLFPGAVTALAGFAAARGVPLHYAVLHADLATCSARMAARDRVPAGRQAERWAAVDLAEAAALLRVQHERFADLSPYEAHAIDATRPPAEVAGDVLATFTAGRLAVAP